MQQLEAAHLAIIGRAPTYMRPPYFDTNAFVTSTLAGLGYKIISADIDTQDWAEDPIGQVMLSINWYEGNQTAGGSISLNHDVYQPTAEVFVPTVIQYLSAKGLKCKLHLDQPRKTHLTPLAVPVGECLGDDEANWYRNGAASPPTNPPPTNPPPTNPPSNPSGTVSPDSTCGGANRYVCPSGSCCSQYGWW